MRIYGKFCITSNIFLILLKLTHSYNAFFEYKGVNMTLKNAILVSGNKDERPR
ncbi:hypothetical protein NIES3275_67050 [Microchaete diplosiphon NIES-3275]|nr:hypothetical protein NIES3275_67050 [Microchaete diplosiphon NIES-3275]